MENVRVFGNKLKQRRPTIDTASLPRFRLCRADANRCALLHFSSRVVADKRSMRRSNTDRKRSVKDDVTGRYPHNNIWFASVNSAICRSYSGRIDDDQMLAVGSTMSKLVEEALSLAGARLNGLSFAGGSGVSSAGEMITVRMTLPVRPVVGEVAV